MSNIKELLLIGPTQMLRFWFGLTACFFALFIISDGALLSPEYVLSFSVLPQVYWCMLFILNGLALLYGAITSKYSKVGLVLESILGTILWAAIGITVMIAQGSLGAVTISSLISTYLLIRYPIWQGEH